ncbi:cation transporter [Rhizobium leguminosarum bv. trifolii CB782]|uniref:CDF family Co(II)/Ni(II) efflux transporter DmeF n=1 Tax=Rhizobium hidalgonense TaxID=1538159 RepID=A0A2A6K5G0_9HYPH|nr:CDF family Co(II)/Ni(II) efflux transporter DmeF [Rhizobium hidalgonense]AHG44562.1 cation transporter [Rhizobium leguminosarum bv. trifolii CB782]EJC73712.1 cation diffusion facilitator family transporter [Rhizobium leguminosarum bv. trifolii WSM2012]MDR9775301.1 CDF family Co(II)/Ni(II) efflux transporter DmeF [Rhizobium hidalgonense]MDR9808674.1 CDF family Co(II)/Ni(II) efflux transporter DmeF [Rhizobium hidalgonense]MDR9813294.1 CDF family Co(II)/Ni(II) efflux transporter DmeF [Rhizobiu
MSAGIDKAGMNALEHDHIFLGADHAVNERRIWLVIVLTAVMMVAEIAAGTVYGSMALVADGWHMSTHASALLISALAYLFARRQARNPRFTFGTGKLGDLAGFASAIILALIALLMAWESWLRLSNPVPIGFAQAIAVAVIGLAVNLISAWLLAGGGHAHGHHAHGHGHHHHGGHTHDHHARDHHAKPGDNNIRAAYLHVVADAMTSVLAIAALTLGSLYGWLWLDPVMGIVGGLVIANWSWSLLKSSGGVLLDVVPHGETLPAEIREAIETEEDRITDLHVWQVGPGHHAAIVAVVTATAREPAFYKGRLSALTELSHVTVEVTRAA